MHETIVITLTCWLCTIIAAPRKPRLSDEVGELVYSRLLGRQQRLALLAVAATAALFFTVVLSLPQRVDTTPDTASVSIVPTSKGCNDEMNCPWMYQPPRP